MEIKSYYLKISFLFFSIVFFPDVMAQPSHLSNPGNSMQIADSLYYAQNWHGAVSMYEKLLGDTSRNSIAWNRLGFSNYNLGSYDKALRCYRNALGFTPVLPVKASAYSRMARILSLKNEKQKALEAMDSALSAGYTNLSEIDSLKDFKNIRSEPAFILLRQKVYAITFPCMADAHARQFDFWAGEWNVYVAGTRQYAGHSLVQIISGGCALLENWDSPSGTGKSINFIDPNTHKWKQSWAGSYAGGIQEFVNGEYRDSAMRFDFSTSDGQGNKIIGRFIFYNLGPDQIRQFNEISNDLGKTWTTGYDFLYLRKK